MSIDTETKRKSMLGFGTGDFLPHPDGTIAVGDRLTLLELYFGLTPSEPTGRWEYAATYAPWEYAAPLSIEYAADGLVEHAVEAP